MSILWALCGSICGVALFYCFFGLFAPFTNTNLYAERVLQRYTGVVERHAPNARTIDIVALSTLPESAPDIIVRFSYDDDTTWATSGVLIRGGVVEGRTMTIGSRENFNLPKGAFVAVQRDIGVDVPFRARTISFVTRNEL